MPKTLGERLQTVLGTTAGAASWQTAENIWDQHVAPSLEGNAALSIANYILRCIFVALLDAAANLAVDFACDVFRNVSKVRSDCKNYLSEYFSVAKKSAVLNAVNGFFWQPIVDAGVSAGAGKLITNANPDANTAYPIAVATVMIFGWTAASTGLLKRWFHLASPSVKTNALADTAFYVQGPIPEVGSGEGNRNIGWAGLFVLSASMLGEVVDIVDDKCGISERISRGAKNIWCWCRGRWGSEAQPLIPNSP